MPLEDVARLFGDHDELARLGETHKAVDEELDAHGMNKDAQAAHNEEIVQQHAEKADV